MYLAIDIASDNVAVILAKPDGGAELALRSALPTDGGAPAVWLAAMQTARETLLRAHVLPAQIARTALAFHGPVDEHGRVGKGPRTEGWEGFDLPRALREHLEVAAVMAENCVVCEALGEASYGALRNLPDQAADWLYVHLGSRIEGVASLASPDGSPRLLRGANRAALQLGALCIERDGVICASGRRGCLDGYCGAEAFLTRAASYGLTLRSASEVFDLAGSNFGAQSLCEDFLQRLAQGLGQALVVLNPSRLVLGGGLTTALGERLLEPLRQRLGNYCLPEHVATLRIALGQFGADAAVMGAVAVAIQTSSEPT